MDTESYGGWAAQPNGSAVIVHSALWHARRAKPGFVSPRYFVDVSYCQRGKHRWTAYAGAKHSDIFKVRASCCTIGLSECSRLISLFCAQVALEMGHDRGGALAHIFDDTMFYTDWEVTIQSTNQPLTNPYQCKDVCRLRVPVLKSRVRVCSSRRRRGRSRGRGCVTTACDRGLENIKYIGTPTFYSACQILPPG